MVRAQLVCSVMLFGDAAGVRVEALQRLLSERSRERVRDVHPRERAHPDRALLPAEILEEGELHVAPLFDGFREMVEVVVIVEFTDDALVLVDDAQHAVVVVHVAVGVDQGHVEGGNVREAVHRASILFVEVVEQSKTVLRVVDDLVDRREPLLAVEQTVAFGAAQILVDASWHRVDAVHSPAEDGFDDLLAPLAQHDHSPHQRGVRLDEAEEVALLGRGVHPEHHLGDHQVEICRRVGLQHLRVMAETADLLGRPRQSDLPLPRRRRSCRRAPWPRTDGD